MSRNIYFSNKTPHLTRRFSLPIALRADKKKKGIGYYY